MDAVTFSGVLLNPPEPRHLLTTIEKEYYNTVQAVAKQSGWKQGSRVRVTIETWTDGASVEAFNLFHLIRDRLAEETGGKDREWKDQLKQELKAKYGVSKGIALADGTTGVWLKSTKDYTTKEMYALIQGAIHQCEEFGVGIQDLLPETREIGSKSDL